MLAKGSVHWVLLPLILAVFSFFLYIPLAILYLLITIFFLIFFRDPERTPKEGIVACADGKIAKIEETEHHLKIITIMNLHNVHVNRAPISGIVKNIEHRDGKHVPAFSKDSEANERVITTMDTKIGEVKIVQIAGAFARRILPYVKKGNEISKGQRIGIIRFGSRVDLYLPKNKVKAQTDIGSKVKAAESTIAREIANED
jgi:phosphatidylserine decarboxylase